MKTQTFTCILSFAFLTCVTPVVAVAGQAANAYVTVKTDKGDVTLCGDDMNFHLSLADGPVTVEVTANVPYILVPTNPSSQQIVPHQTVRWAVMSEDGEIRTATGTIGFCAFVLCEEDDQHDDNPQFKIPIAHEVTENTNPPHYSGNNPAKCVNIIATAEEGEQGRHTIELIYEPCPTCKTAPQNSEFIRFTSFNTFQWKWKLVSGNKDTTFLSTGNELNENIPVVLLTGQAEVFVRGFWTGCFDKKCTHSASFKIDPNAL